MSILDDLISNGSLPWINYTYPNTTCSGDIGRNSCAILSQEASKRDVIATVRIVISVLSICGSLSIIVSAIIRRQVKNPKILPIFIISIADFLLALTWVVGGALWFSHLSQRVWCFLPSLLTVILVCITANLTVVYAIFSYFNLKHKDFQSILANMHQAAPQVSISRCTTFFIYATAWCVPVFIVGLAFVTVDSILNLIRDTKTCSCWCLPYFGNVLPFAFQSDGPTAHYLNNMRSLVVMYSTVLSINYFSVFVLLVIIYWKILRRIKHLRQQHQQIRKSHPHYGSVDVLIMRGQSQARKRIVYFLTVFIITGFANLLLSLMFMVFESIGIDRGTKIKHYYNGQPDHLTAFPLAMYIIQSVTVPLQGFLNALVYGWTRGEFVKTITHKRINSHGTLTSEGESDFGNSGSNYTTSLLASKRWSRSATASGKSNKSGHSRRSGWFS